MYNRSLHIVEPVLQDCYFHHIKALASLAKIAWQTMAKLNLPFCTGLRNWVSRVTRRYREHVSIAKGRGAGVKSPFKFLFGLSQAKITGSEICLGFEVFLLHTKQITGTGLI